METTFCEDNQSNQAPFGGILSNSTVNDDGWNHLSQVVSSWEDAFNSPLVSQEAYTQFFDFDKNIVLELLDQPNCVSLRIFPGFDEKGKITACIVGVMADKSEIITDGNIKFCCCPSNGPSGILDML